MASRKDRINPLAQARTSLALVAVFAIFVAPLTIGGFSVNYSFVLFPMGWILLNGRARVPDRLVVLCTTIFVCVFMAASAYQVDAYSHFARRAMSFLTVMSIFSFAIVRFDHVMLRAFKSAVVLAATVTALWVSVEYFAAGGAALGGQAKTLVGSQRYAFVYLAGLWILVLNRPATPALDVGRWLLVLVMLAGVALSFSRTSILALIVSAVGVAAWRFAQAPELGQWGVRDALVRLSVLTALTIVLAVVLPATWSFYNWHLVDFLWQGVVDPTDPTTSEGTRVALWSEILDFVSRNPLTGTGFLGVWTLGFFGDGMGSAHNQYLDVLLRTGFVGFAAFAALLIRTGARLWMHHQDLFWGYVSILVFGFFHETFKESHGAFLLAVFLALTARPSALRSGSASDKLLTTARPPGSPDGRLRTPTY